MEGAQMVGHSIDEIQSVVHKLTEVMKSSPEVLRQDLESLKYDLEKIPDAGLRDDQVKVWVKQVQELVYDFEDWKLESEAGMTNSSKSQDSEWQISKFKHLIKDARERYARYDLLKKALTTDADLIDASSSKAEATSDDPPQLWGHRRPVLIGMDGPKTELIQNHLNDKKKTLTVVSILGEGGLGKTTLANEIYEDLTAQFPYRASVFLGRNPTMKKILLDIIRQVNHPTYNYDRISVRSEWDERVVIPQIREFLRDKRYLILIDDIHSTWVWKVLNCVFPDNDSGSRILVTTLAKDIAESCSQCRHDVIYRMKAISSEDSRTLLDRNVSLPNTERMAAFKEVSDRMLKMCGGVPLAIILTGGLLSSRSIMLGRLQFQVFGQNCSRTQYVRKILDITFADMSLQVKHCFLYLNTFPVNFRIQKDHLIQKWVAEGLLQKREGKSVWETGESCFNELIYRRLIQTICGYSDDEVVSCTIHAEIHDFIASMAREENFVIAAEQLVSGPFPCNTIRRYSVHSNDEAETLVSSTVHLSRLRYLTILGYGTVPDLSVFKHLLVLDLKYTFFSYESQMHIRSLSHLRYLAHGSSADTNQANQVEVGGLEHLETLDVSRIRKAQFSVSIYRLPKLKSMIGEILLLPAFEESMGMINWEEMSITIDSPEQYYTVAELLAKSGRLKKLHICYFYNNSGYLPMENTHLNVIRICKIECLFIVFYHRMTLPLGWTPSPCLKRFVLKNSIPRVPDTWELLINLTHLDIRVDEVGAGDVFVLGKLPNLLSLKLYSQGYDKNGWVTVYAGYFRSLKVAWFNCLDDGMGLQFIYGTMPVLQRLRLDFNERKTREVYGRKFDFGIQFPLHLTEVHIIINCKGSTNEDVSDAEAAINDQIRDHINKPRLFLRRDDQQLIDKEMGAPWSEGKVKPMQSGVFRSW